MAIPKRAKKFRQKHLSDKIEQTKREKKHAKLIQSRKRKPTGNAPSQAPKVDLNVPNDELFDGENKLDKFISDDEEEFNSDAEADVAAEEAEYLDGDEETDSLESVELPEHVDAKLVAKWAQNLRKSPKNLPLIVRAATHEEIGRIKDSKTLDELRQLLLEGVPQAVQKFYPSPKAIKGVRGTFKALADVLASLLTDIGSGAGTAADALMSVVECCASLLPYFTAFGREYRQLIRGLAAVVTRADRDDSVKLKAFDALKSAPMRVDVAKIAYASLVKSSAKTSVFTMEGLNLAKSLFALLFQVSESEDIITDTVDDTKNNNVDEEVSVTEKTEDNGDLKVELYQLAFQQIRQLALQLKSALDKVKHPEYDTKVIYTWQFVQSIDFWSRCISLSPYLSALVHPLCQITLRVISLVPSAQYLPLRLFCLRSLVRIGHHTGVYIPLAPPLIDAVLRSSSVLSKPAQKARKDASTLTQPDFEAILHVPQGYLGTKVYQNAVLDEFCDALVECLVLYAKSIAFPELVAPLTVTIRRFVKHEGAQSQNPRIKQMLVGLCERLDTNAKFILKHRSKVNYGPRDKAAIESFLADLKWEDTPLGKEAIARRRVRDERRRLAREGLQNEEQAEQDDFGSSDDEDDQDMNSEDEEEVRNVMDELQNLSEDEEEMEDENEEELEDEDEDEEEME